MYLNINPSLNTFFANSVKSSIYIELFIYIDGRNSIVQTVTSNIYSTLLLEVNQIV